MAKATSGNAAQFTYDFGIAIAQSTVRKIERLTGTTLSLASAYYALQKTSKEYISTLRENTAFYGGLLHTMLAMEQAQNRLLKGQSYFDVKDQLTGMRQLQAAGVDVQKNFEWINKSAHAMGKSYTEFAGAISNAIAGNMSGLVEMGLLTQRATRMFEKYGSNTIMREKAIINFLRQHKGLQQAIANDFETIQDQVTRFGAFFKSFFRGILGFPNDPTSLYGTITMTFKAINEAFERNRIVIENCAFFIGQVLTKLAKAVGKITMWVGKQVKKVADFLGLTSDKFAAKFRSFEVWLEFWKVRVKQFFEEYKTAVTIAAAVTSALLFASFRKNFLLFTKMGIGFATAIKMALLNIVRTPFVIIERLLFGIGLRVMAFIKSLFTMAMAHPVITLIIAGLVLLYKKCEGFRKVINTIVGITVEGVKFVWNSLNALYLGLRVLLRNIGEAMGKLFDKIKTKVSEMWATFMNTKVGQFIHDKIVTPLKNVFQWVLDNIWSPIKNFFTNVLPNLFGWLRGKNNDFANTIKQIGEEQGIKVAPIGSDMSKSTEDIVNKDYLSFGKTTNPILDSQGPTLPTPKEEPSHATVNYGDIKIIVEGGHFDETKLAQKIKEVLADQQRQGLIRAGM